MKARNHHTNRKPKNDLWINRVIKKGRGNQRTKAIFYTEDQQKIKLLAKSEDLAFFVWDLVHKSYKDLEEKGIDIEPFYEMVNELLDEHGIIIDELTN